MDEAYWNAMADRFGEDVLEIASHDPNGRLPAEIEWHASPQRTAADLGCGPGSLLPPLAAAFREVVAVDYSQALLDRAAATHRQANLRFVRHDLASREPPPFAVDVAFCVNALIAPSPAVRQRMLATLHAATRPRGAAVVVVPAFESVFHVYHSLVRIRRHDGKPAGLGPRKADRLLREEVDSFAGGIVRVSGVPTKYWMREELVAALADAGFHVERIDRVHYAWDEEIEHRPEWLDDPRPWDWLAVARSPAEDA